MEPELWVEQPHLNLRYLNLLLASAGWNNCFSILSSKENCSEPQSKGAPMMWTQREVAQLNDKPNGVKMLYPWPQNVDRVFQVSLWMTPVKKLESDTQECQAWACSLCLNYQASGHRFSIVYPNSSTIDFGKHSFKDTLTLNIFVFHTDSTDWKYWEEKHYICTEHL